MAFRAHHLAWLEKHPERDAAWLAAKLREGFDIHHADGDHANNDPLNLLLVYHPDHMDLHGRALRRVLRDGQEERKAARRAERNGGYAMATADLHRDPARVERILKLLRRIWTRDPDFRLMQIIGNAASSDLEELGYFFEDDVLERRLRFYAERGRPQSEAEIMAENDQLGIK